MKVQTICDAMNRIAPKHLAEEWDNPGLLIGNPNQSVNKILICLDVSEQVIEHAIKISAQMIISHHPLIFRAMKNIRTNLPLGHKIELLIKNDIACFAAHTNLDSAEGGVNDVLAEKIGLIDVKPFDEDCLLGRIGKLEREMTAEEFAIYIKHVLKADDVRLICAGQFTIKKVGICSGAGSEFISKAKFLGADAFVTGDVKYHEAQSAVENKIHVIDAGHFATEFPIVHSLAERLTNEFKRLKLDMEIVEDNYSKDFFKVI